MIPDFQSYSHFLWFSSDSELQLTDKLTSVIAMFQGRASNQSQAWGRARRRDTTSLFTFFDFNCTNITWLPGNRPHGSARGRAKANARPPFAILNLDGAPPPSTLPTSSHHDGTACRVRHSWRSLWSLWKMPEFVSWALWLSLWNPSRQTLWYCLSSQSLAFGRMILSSEHCLFVFHNR